LKSRNKRSARRLRIGRGILREVEKRWKMLEEARKGVKMLGGVGKKYSTLYARRRK
jgi:hypothetical protein